MKIGLDNDSLSRMRRSWFPIEGWIAKALHRIDAPDETAYHDHADALWRKTRGTWRAFVIVAFPLAESIIWMLLFVAFLAAAREFYLEYGVKGLGLVAGALLAWAAVRLLGSRVSASFYEATVMRDEGRSPTP